MGTRLLMGGIDWMMGFAWACGPLLKVLFAALEDVELVAVDAPRLLVAVVVGLAEALFAWAETDNKAIRMRLTMSRIAILDERERASESAWLWRAG